MADNQKSTMYSQSSGPLLSTREGDVGSLTGGTTADNLTGDSAYADKPLTTSTSPNTPTAAATSRELALSLYRQGTDCISKGSPDEPSQSSSDEEEELPSSRKRKRGLNDDIATRQRSTDRNPQAQVRLRDRQKDYNYLHDLKNRWWAESADFLKDCAEKLEERGEGQMAGELGDYISRGETLHEKTVAALAGRWEFRRSPGPDSTHHYTWDAE
jgi:hypothetical protein